MVIINNYNYITIMAITNTYKNNNKDNDDG